MVATTKKQLAWGKNTINIRKSEEDKETNKKYLIEVGESDEEENDMIKIK